VSEPDERNFHIARMVLSLRQAGVVDQRVTEAMEKTPREPFTPRPFLESAWENVELPIDCGQTMMRPVMAGAMINALAPAREHTVLEIGTGTGYVTAVLARLSRRVYSIDRYRTLVDRARSSLDSLGISRVELRLADGLLGWPEAAPFDRIIVMGAMEFPLDLLRRQLAPGGVAVIPVERDGEGQILRFEKSPDGHFTETLVTKARLGPLQPGVAREL
jgi:protein-L-isoaspartate(D-aspartate) O-methyltransferase